eukprot:359676-Chlamydomonas_euryale.AAC.4
MASNMRSIPSAVAPAQYQHKVQNKRCTCTTTTRIRPPQVGQHQPTLGYKETAWPVLLPSCLQRWTPELLVEVWTAHGVAGQAANCVPRGPSFSSLSAMPVRCVCFFGTSHPPALSQIVTYPYQPA